MRGRGAGAPVRLRGALGGPLTAGDARALAATVAVLLSAAAAAEPPPPIAVRAEPATLTLGRGATARLVLDVGTEEAPVPSASAGRIEGLRALEGGRFEATYVAPLEAHPQVAIVAVTAGDRFGWVAIPLVGRGLALARSSPGAAIEVTIGDTTFGPVRADRSGVARVPVVVPPGVGFAYHRGEPLDLRVPPTLHVHLAAARLVLAADAGAEIPVFAAAVAPDGSPRAGAPVEVSATAGEVSLAEVAPGTFAGAWRLPAGAAGEATATIRLADEPGPAGTVAVSRPAGAPARLAIDGAPARLSADDEAPVALRIAVTDAAGNPVAAEPDVEATAGTVTGPLAAGPGLWTAALAPPEGRARRVELTVRAAGLEERVAIDVAAGAPVRLEVVPDAPVLVADGAAEARVRVSARDRFGNPAVVPAPEVEATRRASVAAEPDGAGWVLRYRPRRAREDASELLSVRAGALSSSARIAIVAPERRVAVAPRLGLALTTGGVRASYAGAEAAYRTRVADGRLALALELGWLVHERTDDGSAGAVAVPVHGRARYAPLLASAWWRQALGARSVAWAGLGAGIAQVASEVAAGDQPAIVESGVVPAAHASVAFGAQLGHGAPFLELRALWQGDPGFESLSGALSLVSVSVGYRYDAY